MATPLINGTAYTWASIKFALFGVEVVGIKKISFKEKQKKDNIYGLGDKPIARGRGNYEYEGSIEIMTEEWKRIIAASPNRNPLAIDAFDIPVLYGNNAINPENKDILKAVEFLENPFDAGQGDTSLWVTIPLIIAAIER